MQTETILYPKNSREVNKMFPHCFYIVLYVIIANCCCNLLVRPHPPPALQPLWRKDDKVTALQSSSSSLSSFKKKNAVVEICEHIVLGWENSSCSEPDELNTHRLTVPLTLSSSTREPFRTWGNRTAANIQHISTSPSAGSLNVSPWHYSETTLSQTSWDVESSWNSSAQICANFFFLFLQEKQSCSHKTLKLSFPNVTQCL